MGEDERMVDAIEGFYSVYLTGKEGQGFALTVFTAGRVVGAGATGDIFDGKYSIRDNVISLSLSVKTPPNRPLIQGGLTGPQGEVNDIDIDLPHNFASQNFIRVETQHGPVKLN